MSLQKLALLNVTVICDIFLYLMPNTVTSADKPLSKKSVFKFFQKYYQLKKINISKMQ